jgi:hypothetical protein
VGATGVDVVGAVDEAGAGGDGVVVVMLAGVSFCFVGVAVLESSLSESESESESQVRSSFVVCAAPVFGLLLACCSSITSLVLRQGLELGYTYP